MALRSSISQCAQRTMDFEGRTARSVFWPSFAAMLIFCASTPLLTALLLSVTPRGYNYYYGYHPIIWIAAAICLPTFLSCCYRRLHDVGLPGYLVFLPPLVIVVAFFGARFISGTPGSGHYNGYASWPFLFAMFPAFLLSIATVLIMLALPSRKGPNKYGPNPHEVT